MQAKQRRGFTLVEVVIAFALISCIVAMVSGSIVSYFTMARGLKKLSATYYSAQNSVEEKMKTISPKVQELAKKENEQRNASDPSVYDGDIATLKTALTGAGGFGTTETTVSLLGKGVTVYTFTEHHSTGDGNLTLHAGVVDMVRKEPAIPGLEWVRTNSSQTDPTSEPEDLYPLGNPLTLYVHYNCNVNDDKVASMLYQWYVSKDLYHAYDRENLSNPTLARYPMTFDPIGTPTESNSLTITDAYKGRIVVCVAVPISTEGYRGAPMNSNPLYISELPSLTSGTYKALFDASFEDQDETLDGEHFSSRYPNNSFPITTNAQFGRIIKQIGDSDSDSPGIGMGNCKSSGKLIEDNLDSNDVVFMVANGSDMYSGTGPGYECRSNGGGDWNIVVQSDFSGTPTVALGMKFAELIVVEDMDLTQQDANDDAMQIVNYLAKKYGIEPGDLQTVIPSLVTP